MNNESDTSSIILVVEDVNETRDGIEKLLKAVRLWLEAASLRSGGSLFSATL